MLLLGMVVITWFFIIKKQINVLLLICVYFFGYLILTNISYADGANQFYIENLYLPLSFFILVPLIFNVWEYFSQRNWALIVFVGIVCIRLFSIYNGHEKFSERLSWQRDLLYKTTKFINKKLVFAEEDALMDKLMITWASSYEFWLLSTLETNETRSIIIYEKPGELNWALKNSNVFLTNWGTYKYEELPENYFNFKDTVTNYVIFKLKDLK